MAEIVNIVEALVAKRGAGFQPFNYVDAHEALVAALRNYISASDDMCLHGVRNGTITIPEAKEEAKRLNRYSLLLRELEDLDG